jgi:hypothetical protein
VHARADIASAAGGSGNGHVSEMATCVLTFRASLRLLLSLRHNVDVVAPACNNKK